MASPSLPLYIALALLMVDSIIELSFISSTVAWLHRRAGGSFDIAYNGSSYSLHGKPLNEHGDHGHTDNGAAGAAFVLVGLGGILVLYLRSRPNAWKRGVVKVLYHIWMVMTVLSALLTLSGLIFTFVIVNQYKGQTIDQSVASGLDNRPYPDHVPYPLDDWTPENWFAAVLELDLVHQSDRDVIELKHAIMVGWRWNLVPMFVLGVAVAVLAVLDALKRRKAARAGSSQHTKSGEFI